MLCVLCVHESVQREIPGATCLLMLYRAGNNLLWALIINFFNRLWNCIIICRWLEGVGKRRVMCIYKPAAAGDVPFKKSSPGPPHSVMMVARYAQTACPPVLEVGRTMYYVNIITDRLIWTVSCAINIISRPSDLNCCYHNPMRKPPHKCT